MRIVDQAILGRSKGAFLQTYFIMMNPEYQEWIPRPGALGRIMERIKPISYIMDNETYAASLPPLRRRSSPVPRRGPRTVCACSPR